MSEAFAEQLNRVHLMSMDDCGETWDLSTNDCAAIRAVLESHDRLAKALEASACRLFAELPEREDDGFAVAPHSAVRTGHIRPEESPG